MSNLLYPFTDPLVADEHPPLQMQSGDGCYVSDTHQNTYFDAVSGLWCAALGFNHPRLREAASEQMDRLAYYHSFMGRTCEITVRLADRLVQKLPGDLNHVFFGTSGSEAVEHAVKFAHYYQNARGKTGKKKVIARAGAYHGSGLMSAALTAMEYCHDGFDLPLHAVLRTGRPHYFADAQPGETELDFSRRRARELEALIDREGADTIAAFIGEPVMGSGGVILPPEGYWDEIQAVLRKHDILLIADEVITGFGRTGQWFGCETYGIRPDMMTMAKQLTGAVFPMSAVAMTGAMYDTIARFAHEHATFGHGVTYGGHPVGAAVALAALDIYEEMNLPVHVGRLGARLAAQLATLNGLPGVVDIRSVGLLAGVQFGPGATAGAELVRRVGAAAQQRGVLFRVIDDVIGICPPYVSTAENIDQIIAVLRESILVSAA